MSKRKGKDEMRAAEQQPTEADRIPLPEARWFVALVHPRMEFKAATEMRRFGYYTWLPYIVVKKTLKRPNSTVRKIITEDRAYYSRYVFAGLKYQGQDLSGMHDIACVSTVVKSPMTGRPLQIPDAVMDRIWQLGDGTEFIREVDEVSAKSRRKYRKGDAVKLTGTPFDDFVALVSRDIGGKELFVEVEVFGAKREVAVKPEQIEDDKRKAA